VVLLSALDRSAGSKVGGSILSASSNALRAFLPLQQEISNCSSCPSGTAGPSHCLRSCLKASVGQQINEVIFPRSRSHPGSPAPTAPCLNPMPSPAQRGQISPHGGAADVECLGLPACCRRRWPGRRIPVVLPQLPSQLERRLVGLGRAGQVRPEGASQQVAGVRAVAVPCRRRTT
jgi:hypothetical protein